MNDVLLVISTTTLFVIALAYVTACDRLKGGKSHD